MSTPSLIPDGNTGVTFYKKTPSETPTEQKTKGVIKGHFEKRSQESRSCSAPPKYFKQEICSTSSRLGSASPFKPLPALNEMEEEDLSLLSGASDSPIGKHSASPFSPVSLSDSPMRAILTPEGMPTFRITQDGLNSLGKLDICNRTAYAFDEEGDVRLIVWDANGSMSTYFQDTFVNAIGSSQLLKTEDDQNNNPEETPEGAEPRSNNVLGIFTIEEEMNAEEEMKE